MFAKSMDASYPFSYELYDGEKALTAHCQMASGK